MVSEADKSRLRVVRDCKRVLRTLPKDRRGIGDRLVEELLFMWDTLAALKQEVTENGATEQFKQGKQQFTRESPALKAYNTTIQRYSLLYKQLTDLMPKPVFTQATEDRLNAFMDKWNTP